MNKKNLLKKTKKIARKTLIMTLCLAAVLSICPIGVHAASYTGYEWTKIDSKEEFESYCNGIMKSSDGDMKTGAEYEPGTGDTPAKPNNSDWIRCMFVYDNDQYFTSGNDTCNKNRNYLGKRILASYGIDTKKENFITVSGLNTPYIKYCKDDSDNGCRRYYVRYSDNDVLGKTYWTMYCKWYGKSYAAACRCDFNRPGQSIDNYRDDANWWTFQSIKWYGDRVQIFYNIRGAADRGWEHRGGGQIECTQDYDDVSFRIFLGTKLTIVNFTASTEIEPKEMGEVTVWGNGIDSAPLMISEGTTITIEKDATLVIDGVLINDGKIHIDGGTLLIRGVVDSDVGLSSGAGSITMNGGTLIVDEGGALLTRDRTATFSFDNKAHVEIQGIAVFIHPFTMHDSDFRASYNSAVLIGVKPGETTNRSQYTAKKIIENKDWYLSSFCSNDGTPYGSLYIPSGCTLTANGLFYVNPSTTVTVGEYAHIDARKSTNIDAKISSMNFFKKVN